MLSKHNNIIKTLCGLYSQKCSNTTLPTITQKAIIIRPIIWLQYYQDDATICVQEISNEYGITSARNDYKIQSD